MSDLTKSERSNYRARHLERRLVACLDDKSAKGLNRYNSHEALDAVVTVAAATIYRCAEDDGAKLARLLGQFQHELTSLILQVQR